MEKIKQLMNSPVFSLCLVALFTLRLVIYGAGIGDALALLSLCGLNAFNLYQKTMEYKPLSDEIRQEVNEIKNAVAVMGMKNIKQQAKPEDIKPGRFF